MIVFICGQYFGCLSISTLPLPPIPHSPSHVGHGPAPGLPSTAAKLLCGQPHPHPLRTVCWRWNVVCLCNTKMQQNKYVPKLPDLVDSLFFCSVLMGMLDVCAAKKNRGIGMSYIKNTSALGTTKKTWNPHRLIDYIFWCVFVSRLLHETAA